MRPWNRRRDSRWPTPSCAPTATIGRAPLAVALTRCALASACSTPISPARRKRRSKSTRPGSRRATNHTTTSHTMHTLTPTPRFVVGDLVQYWFDTGAMGASILYGVVVEAGPKTARIVWESSLSNRIAQDKQDVRHADDYELALKCLAARDIAAEWPKAMALATERVENLVEEMRSKIERRAAFRANGQQ